MLTGYLLYKAIKKIKDAYSNSSITSQKLGTQTSVLTENKPFQNSKCPVFGSCDINYIESDEIPEGSSPTINKSIETNEEKPISVAPSLFGGGTTTETGEGTLKAGLSTSTLVGIAGAGVLLIVLIAILGGKK